MTSDPAAEDWQVPWVTRLGFTAGVFIVLYSNGCSDEILSCVAGPMGYWVLCRPKEQLKLASNCYECKLQELTTSTAWLYFHHTGWVLGIVRCFWQLLHREPSTGIWDNIWNTLWLPRGLLRGLQAWFEVQLYWPLLIVLLGIYSRVVFHQMWDLLSGQTEWVWCLPAFNTCWQNMKRKAHSWGLITLGATESDAAADADAANEATITALRNTITALKNDIDSLKNNPLQTQNQGQMKELETMLHHYNDQIASLKSSNAQNLKALGLKDSMISGLQLQVEENKTLGEQLAKVTQQLEAADNTIQQLQAQQPPSSPNKRTRTRDHTLVDQLHASDPKKDKYLLCKLYEAEGQEKLLLCIGIVGANSRGKWQIKWHGTAEPLIPSSESFKEFGNPSSDLRRMCNVPAGKIQLNPCNDGTEELKEDWFKDTDNEGEYIWCSAWQAPIWELHNLFAYGDSALLRNLEEFLKSCVM